VGRCGELTAFAVGVYCDPSFHVGLPLDMACGSDQNETIPYARRRACIPQTPRREPRGLFFEARK